MGKKIEVEELKSHLTLGQPRGAAYLLSDRPVDGSALLLFFLWNLKWTGTRRVESNVIVRRMLSPDSVSTAFLREFARSASGGILSRFASNYTRPAKIERAIEKRARFSFTARAPRGRPLFVLGNVASSVMELSAVHNTGDNIGKRRAVVRERGILVGSAAFIHLFRSIRTRSGGGRGAKARI